jgi:hypothetical protein
MEQIKTLNKVYKSEIDVLDAYHEIYKPKEVSKHLLKKSYFIYIRIKIKDHPGVSTLIRLFTLLPVPTFIVKFFLKRSNVNPKDFLSQSELLELISVKNISVEVMAEDVHVKIKTI